MRVGVLCCVLAGCFTPSPQAGAPCGNNRECPDGLECNAENKCEKPGTTPDGTTGDACPGNTCVGDLLVGCGTSVTCTTGCGGSTPHCLQLAPSNGLDASMLVGATADITTDKLNFDAGDGSIRMMNTDIRPAGTGVKAGIRWEVVAGVSVWTANTWTLLPGRDWSFSGTRPVTLFANTTITIGNSLLVNATGSVGSNGGTSSNAGTAAGCQGRAGRNIDATHGEGGGGGGGGNNAKGGDGGQSNVAGFTGLGGMCATRPTTIPLVGGNGGGASGTSLGGGGGGGISLVAMQAITITSSISASGAGGGVASGNGGGGGGGGGAIFIEAPSVIISGQLTANGGGGGSPGGQAEGNDGTTASSTAAAGGSYTGSGGPAKGGNGGAGITPPQVGTSYNFDDTVNLINYNRGGGGGGGFGVIEVKRKTGGVSGLASPAATITNAVFE